MLKEEYATAIVRNETLFSTAAQVQLSNHECPLGKHAKVRQEKLIQAENVLAYPIDTSLVLQGMIDLYMRNDSPQVVSFRRLVDWLKVGERATHYLHPYPAKLLPQIAHFFLSAGLLTKRGDVVLDPFGGSGTVALEAMLAGRRGYYADVNPLAQLIARVKTTPIDPVKLRAAQKWVRHRYSKIDSWDLPDPDVVNLSYWYPSTVVNSLLRIREAIEDERSINIRNFMLVAFSAACRKVSRADPRLSVPVRLKGGLDKVATEEQVFKIFEDQCESNIRRMDALYQWTSNDEQIEAARFTGNDARALRNPTTGLGCAASKLRKNSVALILTSPPYAGAQKYIRASSLNLGWLGLARTDGLKPLENASIGREHLLKAEYSKIILTGIEEADHLIQIIHEINPLRSAIVATYLNEMKDALLEMFRVLKPGGHLVLVIGNNEVCGLPFKSADYLTAICEQYGLETRLRMIDEIKSRGLMTKRNKTASMITREWVLLFQKPKEE